MASKAPLVLAAVLFVFGLAGLAQTIRQTADRAASRAPGPLVVAVPSAVAQTAVAEPSFAPPLDELAPAGEGSPSADPAGDSPSPAAPALVSAPDPLPDTAVAAAVASDGAEVVGPVSPLIPLRIGMIGRDSEPPEAGATPAP